MSSSICAVNFSFSDGTTRNYSFGPFSPSSDAVIDFKDRLKFFNSVDVEKEKKFTNLADVLKSENGGTLTGIKSAMITTSQTKRVYDAATYGG